MSDAFEMIAKCARQSMIPMPHVDLTAAQQAEIGHGRNNESTPASPVIPQTDQGIEGHGSFEMPVPAPATDPVPVGYYDCG